MDGSPFDRFKIMAQTPQQDEPKTPMWLPAVGALLFLSVGIWWATRTPEPPPAPADSGVVETPEAGAPDAGPAGAAPARPR